MLNDGFATTWFVLAILSVLQIISAQSCIWKNGQTATNYFACDPTAAQSSCCLGGEACVANGLCYGSLGQIYRGACAGGWGNDTACPTQCNDQGADGSWSNLILCPGISGPQDTHTWWCGNSGDVTPCDEQATASNPTKSQFFTLPLFGMLPEAIMPLSSQGFPGCAVDQDSAWSITKQIQNATENSSSCTNTTSAAGATHTTIAPTTCSCPGGSTGTLAANTTPQTCSNSAQIGEGVAIGVMALIALCTAGWALWERRQKKRILASTTNTLAGPQIYQHYNHFNNGYSKPAQLPDDTTRPSPAEMDSFKGRLPSRPPMQEMHG